MAENEVFWPTQAEEYGAEKNDSVRSESSADK